MAGPLVPLAGHPMFMGLLFLVNGNKIENWLVDNHCSSGIPEVISGPVGESVMRGLKHLGKLACIRFASVCKSFDDVTEFQDAIVEV